MLNPVVPDVNIITFNSLTFTVESSYTVLPSFINCLPSFINVCTSVYLSVSFKHAANSNLLFSMISSILDKNPFENNTAEASPFSSSLLICSESNSLSRGTATPTPVIIARYETIQL